MKKLNVSVFFILFMKILFGQGVEMYEFEPYNFEKNICFNETYTQKIRTSAELNTETLTFPDKLKFKRKEYIRKIREYIDESGDFTSVASFVSQNNMFPRWYSHPLSITTSKSGVYSYFETQNHYLSNGWEGGHYDHVDYGNYITDYKTGQHYFMKKQTIKSQEQYNEVNARVSTYGVLYKYIWRYPKTALINHARSEGFLVNQTSNEIKIQSSTFEHVWNLTNRTYTRKYFENGILERTIHITYVFSENIGNYIMHKEITIVPENFENGDCYETINTTLFTDYNTQCSGEIGVRSANKEGIPKLNVFPNPVTNILNVEFPYIDYNNLVEISIINMAGEIVMMRKYMPFDGKVDVKNLPGGTYVLKIKLNNNDYSIKFVKN